MLHRKYGTTLLLALLALLASACGAVTHAAEESQQIAALRAKDSGAQRHSAVASLWSRVAASGTPLIEPLPGGQRMRVTFLWREAGDETPSNVGLIGSFVPGGARVLLHFARIPDTDVLTSSVIVDTHARYRYYLARPQGRVHSEAAVSHLQLGGASYELFADPRAKHLFIEDDEGAAVRSAYFEGPLAPEEHWLAAREDVPHGTLQSFDLTSAALGDTRSIWVYTPPGVRLAEYPLLVLFDGEAYRHLVPTATILDNLIAERALPALIVVFLSAIDEAHREAQLQPKSALTELVAQELMPRMRRDWPVTQDAHRTVIAGSSLGGLSASWVARVHPELFGNVLSMSGSYWWSPDENKEPPAQGSWLAEQFATGPRLPLRFYLCVGAGEGAGMLAPNRRLRQVLQEQGYPLHYEEYQGDHSYLNWRASLVAGLRYLLGDSQS